MPDADDFDVEYFRNLLKGSGSKEGPAPAAAPAPPSATKTPRRTGKAPVAAGTKSGKKGRTSGR